MALFQHVEDVTSIDVNAVADAATDPAATLARLIKETELELDERTLRLGETLGLQRTASKDLADARAAAAESGLRARDARAIGNESLAREALDMQTAAEREATRLQDAYELLTERVRMQREQVEAVRLCLDEARSRRELVTRRAMQEE